VEPHLHYVFRTPPTTGPPVPLNMARNSDPRIQAALETGRTTSDPATRTKAYQKVNQYLAEDIPYLYGDRSTWAVAAKPTVQNFNNPITPKGSKALGFDAGVIWPTQLWVT
jgi:ABC-type transport system substrate-binding protein